jgi:aldehyde:ferredoxin oxidoreductase
MNARYGWTGRLLRVDLTSGDIHEEETARYVPAYVGGLGVAARIAWEELRPGTGPFDEDNLLMIMAGPLTGTLASGAGRVEVAGIAPQQHPPGYSRSGMGGHWGAELKYAGYDGVVMRGRAPEPVYLWIEDGKAELREAKDLWGLGNFATTLALRRIHGPRVRVVSCGQAGERLSRVAVIQTETGNAAGQGGYGAVMGAKRIKAIAVRGTGGVRLARPEAFMDLCLNASREGQRPEGPGSDYYPPGEAPSGPGYRTRKCGFCATPCTHRLYMAVPGRTTAGTHAVARQCWGYDATSRDAELEARAITSDYGLNGWEIAYGIIPWLQLCRQHGLLDRIDGVEIPVPDRPIGYLRDVTPVSGEFLLALARGMALREGELGNALADGACYAADVLFGGEGKPLLDRIYPRHGGQTEHWGGHWGPGGTVYWPWWLPPILQWCVDTRDPANDSTHQWTEHAQHYLPVSGPLRGPLSLAQARAVCARVYGDPNVCDPAYTYDPPEAKAIPAIWHTDRGMIVDSLVLCDYENTRVFSMKSADGAADTALMSKLFSAATGCEMSESDLDRAGERISNLHRAIDVRNHGRDRAVDESTLDGFMYPGKDDGVTPDRDRLVDLLQTYYRLRGWNPANGWPTRARLESLGLNDVADELASIGRLG